MAKFTSLKQANGLGYDINHLVNISNDFMSFQWHVEPERKKFLQFNNSNGIFHVKRKRTKHDIECTIVSMVRNWIISFDNHHPRYNHS